MDGGVAQVEIGLRQPRLGGIDGGLRSFLLPDGAAGSGLLQAAASAATTTNDSPARTVTG
jgi:hypothetical protein